MLTNKKAESDLKRFISLFTKFSGDLNSLLCINYSKINFNIMIQYMFHIFLNDTNSSVTFSRQLEETNNISISSSGLLKKIKNIDFNTLNAYHSIFIEEFYKVNENLFLDKYRLLACDGTHINFSIHGKGKTEYKPVRSNTYIDCSVSGLYDISNEIILDLHMDPSHSEIKQFYQQLLLIKKNDIIIFDRNYYSKKLLFTVHNKEAYSIFRLKKNNLYVKHLIKNSICDHTFNVVQNNIFISFRVVHYTIENNDYYIGLTVPNLNVDTIKQLYYKRWKIEVYFKTVKYTNRLKLIHFKNIESIKKELCFHKYINIFTSYFEKLQSKYVDPKILNNKKLNTKVNIRTVCGPILRELVKSKHAKSINSIISNILNFMNLLIKHLVRIRLNRKFKRIAKKPPSLWYFTKNKYKLV